MWFWGGRTVGDPYRRECLKGSYKNDTDRIDIIEIYIGLHIIIYEGKL